MKRLLLIIISLGLVATASAGAAQPSHTVREAALWDHRVQAGLVVPLGHAGSKAEQAPRLEAWSEVGHARENLRTGLRDNGVGPERSRARIGLTLGNKPTLMLNGHELPPQDSRHGVSTLGWVGITVGVAVIGFGVLVAANLGDMNN